MKKKWLSRGLLCLVQQQPSLNLQIHQEISIQSTRSDSSNVFSLSSDERDADEGSSPRQQLLPDCNNVEESHA